MSSNESFCPFCFMIIKIEKFLKVLKRKKIQKLANLLEYKLENVPLRALCQDKLLDMIPEFTQSQIDTSPN